MQDIDDTITFLNTAGGRPTPHAAAAAARRAAAPRQAAGAPLQAATARRVGRARAARRPAPGSRSSSVDVGHESSPTGTLE